MLDDWVDAISQRFVQQPDAQAAQSDVARIFEGLGSECASREPNESFFRLSASPAPPDPGAYPFSPNLMMSNFNGNGQGPNVYQGCNQASISNLLSYRSPHVTQLPAQHDSDSDAIEMVFNLQSEVRVMAHELGIPCQEWIPDSAMELSRRKRMLEKSIENLRKMLLLAEKKNSSDAEHAVEPRTLEPRTRILSNMKPT